jgi:tetratricopeptide (TPR) repeat protein
MQPTGPVICSAILLTFLCCAALAQPNSQSSFEDIAQAATFERETGKTEASVRDYQRALAIKPDWTEGWWYLATLHYDADRFADARAEFERVIQQLPSMGAAWSFLGLCEFELKDYTSARGHLEKGAALGPGDDPDLEKVAAHHLALLRTAPAAGAVDAGTFNNAMAAYSSGAYIEAVSLLKTWLGSRPTDGTAWAVLGLSEFELKDYENSRQHLERGLEFGFGGSPESVQLANYRLAILLNRAGEFEEAAAVLNSHDDTKALSKEMEFALGMSLLRIAAFPQDVENSIRAIVQTAGATAKMLHTSQYNLAFENFAAMLKQQPSLPFLHYAYGTALIALSRYDEAEPQMRDELRISPNSELPLLRLASIAIRQLRPLDAMGAAAQALKLAPTSGEAHYLMGRACLEAGQIENAVRELETASTLTPNSPEIHFNLAKAYTRAKNLQKAEQERLTFLRLNALAEQQKGREGSQTYAVPREASDLQHETDGSTTPH